MSDERKVVSLEAHRHRAALKGAQELQDTQRANLPNYAGPFEVPINQNLRRIVHDLVELAGLGERIAKVDPKHATSLRAELIGLVVLAEDVFTGLPFDSTLLDPSS